MHVVTLENARVLYPRSSEQHNEDSLSEPYINALKARPRTEHALADMGEVDYESLPTNSLWQHLLAGGMAGVMEHCCMYPVDCVKVRGLVCPYRSMQYVEYV